MKVPVANNVVSMGRGAESHVAKDAKAKSNPDVPERGSFEAQVTVLFPKAKTTGTPWSKTQKSTLDSGPGSKTQDEANDLVPGQDVFGSLMASVGQKLTQQDDQPTEKNDGQSADALPDASLNRVSQLMRHGVLPDSLQNMTQKTVQQTEKSSESSNMVLSIVPSALDSVPRSQPDSRDDKKNPVDLGQPKDIISAKPLNVQSSSQNETGQRQAVSANDDGRVEPQPPMPEKTIKSAGSDKPAQDNTKDPVPQPGAGQVASRSEIALAAVLVGSDKNMLSPAAQIVENIKSAVPPGPVAPQTGTAAPQAVKTLEIQLQPDGLGPVTVSLKSEQGKLKVQISAKLETTRQELERSSVELVNGLRAVDPTFTDVDVNFSDQNQGTAPDARGQAFSNGGERRGTPENMSGFGSNGGQDADQAGTNRQNAVFGKPRPGQKMVVGELPSRLDRADGIYI